MGLFTSSKLDFGPLNERDDSLPYKNTRWRCFMVHAMYKFLRPWRPSYGRVSFVAPGLVLKTGPSIRLAEALTIDFLAKNTSVPVPRIFTAFEDPDTRNRYILMSRVKGIPLHEAWHHMPQKVRDDVLAQLRAYMSEVRALKPPNPGQVGSFDYTPLWDDRIFAGAFGPFASPEEFHFAVRAGRTEENIKPGGFHSSEKGLEEVGELIQQYSSRQYSIHLTHGDLYLRNIMVHNGKISGIVDWEMAGWFPDYWEYTNTRYSFWQTPHLRPCIDDFLERRSSDLRMEQLRRKHFCKSIRELQSLSQPYELQLEVRLTLYRSARCNGLGCTSTRHMEEIDHSPRTPPRREGGMVSKLPTQLYANSTCFNATLNYTRTIGPT